MKITKYLRHAACPVCINCRKKKRKLNQILIFSNIISLYLSLSLKVFQSYYLYENGKDTNLSIYSIHRQTFKQFINEIWKEVINTSSYYFLLLLLLIIPSLPKIRCETNFFVVFIIIAGVRVLLMILTLRPVHRNWRVFSRCWVIRQ